MKEKISALLDAELEKRELAQVLDELCKNEEMTAVWARYHLISAAAKNAPDIALDMDLADLVVARIEGETKRRAPRRMTLYGLGKPLVSLAIAASVAAIAIFVLRPNEVPDTMGQNQVAANNPARAQVRLEGATRWQTLSPELENTLNAYLVEHGEFTSPSGLNGLTSYARFVSFDADR